MLEVDFKELKRLTIGEAQWQQSGISLHQKHTHIFELHKCIIKKNYVQVDKPYKHNEKKVDTEDTCDFTCMIDMHRQNYPIVTEVRIMITSADGRVLTRKGRNISEVLGVFYIFISSMMTWVCKNLSSWTFKICILYYTPIQFSK